MGIRTRIGLATCAAALVGFAVVQAQQAGSLTALDFFQIHELNARYSHALDSGNGALLASVFTADGVLIDENGRTTTGRAQLTALASGNPSKGPTNLSRYYINLAIDPAPGGANAKVYANISVPQPGQQLNQLITGQYWDELVKTPQGWQIRKRTFIRSGTPRPPENPLALNIPQFVDAPPPATGLGAEDYLQVHMLFHQYGQQWDRPYDGGKVWADLFTPDGTFTDAAGRATTGHDNLQKFIWLKGAWDIGTHMSNIMVEPGPGGTLVAKAYYVRHVVTQGNIPGAPATVVERPSETFVGLPPGVAGADQPAGAIYARLAKTADGWKFRNVYLIAPNAQLPADAAAMFR